MSEMTFKQRVLNEIVKTAFEYKAVFIDYDYLIFSKDSKKKPYYITSASADNYPHLTGEESDFDFASKNRNERDVKGSVRQKIKMLPFLSTLFHMKLQAEENFIKGKIHCSLATSDNALTIGFTDTELLRPKTLLQSNELNHNKVVEITLVLRRKRGSDKFDTLVQGNAEEFCKSFPDLFEAKGNAK